MFVLTEVADKIVHGPISLVINPWRMQPSAVSSEWRAVKLEMLFGNQLKQIRLVQMLLAASLGIFYPSTQRPNCFS